MKRLEPAESRVAWIGTGVMGQSMCGHLLDAGCKTTVYTRSKDKAEPLLQKGAIWADSPRLAAAEAEAVFAIVGFPKDVREIFLGPNGVLAGAKPGVILVDMTTSEPALAVEIEAAARSKGMYSLDAPVSGGDIGAKNAALSIMVGGASEVFDAMQGFFQLLGKTIKLQGPAGSGQHTKMVNQLLIAGNMVGVCEALYYAKKSGLDPLRVIESVSGGAAGSWSISNLGPRIVKRDFEPGFFVEHFIKDMGIALAESKRMGLTLPGLELAEQLYRGVQNQGFGRKGTQALYLALEEMNQEPA